MPAWKQHFEQPFDLYHLSRENLDGVVLTPKALSKERAMESENWRTKRICVSTSIDKALMAFGYSDYDCIGVRLYVHTPQNIDSLFQHDNVYKPSLKQVPDVFVTDEHWLKAKTTMKCIGQIEILDIHDQSGNDEFKYMIYDTPCWCDVFDWKWVSRF